MIPIFVSLFFNVFFILQLKNVLSTVQIFFNQAAECGEDHPASRGKIRARQPWARNFSDVLRCGVIQGRHWEIH